MVQPAGVPPSLRLSELTQAQSNSIGAEEKKSLSKWSLTYPAAAHREHTMDSCQLQQSGRDPNFSLLERLQDQEERWIEEELDSYTGGSSSPVSASGSSSTFEDRFLFFFTRRNYIALFHGQRVQSVVVVVRDIIFLRVVV